MNAGQKVLIHNLALTQPNTTMKFKRTWIFSRPAKIYERVMLHLIFGSIAIQSIEELLRLVAKHLK